MNLDLYHHDILSALRQLASSPWNHVLTWDGNNNYRIQPAEQYCSLADGHRTILTLDALASWTDGDLSSVAIQNAVTWVADNQREWFQEPGFSA